MRASMQRQTNQSLDTAVLFYGVLVEYLQLLHGHMVRIINKIL